MQYLCFSLKYHPLTFYSLILSTSFYLHTLVYCISTDLVDLKDNADISSLILQGSTRMEYTVALYHQSLLPDSQDGSEQGKTKIFTQNCIVKNSQLHKSMIFYTVRGFIEYLGLTDTAINYILSASYASAGVRKKKGEGFTFTSEIILCCIFKADVISGKIMLRQEFSCK